MNIRRTNRTAFTIVEVLLAVGIFGMIMIGIYATWSAIVQGSKAGLNAAAQAQRARVSINAIEEALLTAQMFSANGRFYYFFADNSDETFGKLSFVARLPASFPGVGHYGDSIVRRVTFLVDSDRTLKMRQAPMLGATNSDHEGFELQLAKDVTLFMFEYWDEQKKEYVNEWLSTNQLPKLVRVAIGLGKAANSQSPQDLVTRTIAMPCTAIRPEWQRAPMMPGMPGGMPPGGMPPGAMPPGGMQPGMMPPGGMPPGGFQPNPGGFRQF